MPTVSQQGCQELAGDLVVVDQEHPRRHSTHRSRNLFRRYSNTDERSLGLAPCMPRTSKKKLKSKLLSVIVSAMVVAGLVTLGALGWPTRSIERERLEATKQQIREAI